MAHFEIFKNESFFNFVLYLIIDNKFQRKAMLHQMKINRFHLRVSLKLLEVNLLFK